jgi:hypothetical protein
MNSPRNTISALLLSLLATTVMAEDTSLKEGAKQVGQETGEVVHKVGEGGKDAGKKVAETARDVGHATRDAAKEVGKKVADTAVEVGHATRDGAKEFGKAVKGDSSATSSASSTAHQHKAE